MLEQIIDAATVRLICRKMGQMGVFFPKIFMAGISKCIFFLHVHWIQSSAREQPGKLSSSVLETWSLRKAGKNMHYSGLVQCNDSMTDYIICLFESTESQRSMLHVPPYFRKISKFRPTSTKFLNSPFPQI